MILCKSKFHFSNFSRHGIERGTSIQKSLKDVKFFDEFVENSDIAYVPGGCQFNAMRVFNVF